jgi:PhnB protein
MQINPYLMFKGDCEEAFKFYASVFGSKDLIVHRFGDNPGSAASVPDDWRSKIMHARITVDGVMLMGSDAPPGRQQDKGGFSVSVNVAKPAEGERLFNALAEGGQTIMPYQKTFWAAGFGMLVDRFGTPWMVNCETTQS